MLVNGSDFYCGNSSGSPCQFALKSQIPSQYVHPSTKQCNYSIDTSQFASVSDLNSLKNTVGNPCKVSTIYDGPYSFTMNPSGKNSQDVFLYAENRPATNGYSIHRGSMSDISITWKFNENFSISYDRTQSAGPYPFGGNSSTYSKEFWYKSSFSAGESKTLTYDPIKWLSSTETASFCIYASFGTKVYWPSIDLTLNCYLKIVQLEF